MNTLYIAITFVAGGAILPNMVHLAGVSWQERDAVMFALSAFAAVVWGVVVYTLFAEVMGL